MRQLLQKVLAHLGPRQGNAQQEDLQHGKSHQSEHIVRERERERSPRRRDDVVDQEAVLAGHMRDLLRSCPPTFDGSSSGLDAETWLIDLDRCFAMHPYGSNTKARCAIMHLRGFASTWWRLEEQKINVDIASVSWELFIERFMTHFLSDHWRQCHADEFHELRQMAMTMEQYEHRFFELKQYADIGNDEAMLVQHFIRGSNAHISRGV